MKQCLFSECSQCPWCHISMWHKCSGNAGYSNNMCANICIYICDQRRHWIPKQEINFPSNWKFFVWKWHLLQFSGMKKKYIKNCNLILRWRKVCTPESPWRPPPSNLRENIMNLKITLRNRVKNPPVFQDSMGKKTFFRLDSHAFNNKNNNKNGIQTPSREVGHGHLNQYAHPSPNVGKRRPAHMRAGNFLTGDS